MAGPDPRADGRPRLLHTSRDRVADIVARAKREHPYEVPGISARPIIDGNPDYLAWIAKATGTPSAPERTGPVPTVRHERPASLPHAASQAKPGMPRLRRRHPRLRAALPNYAILMIKAAALRTAAALPAAGLRLGRPARRGARRLGKPGSARSGRPSAYAHGVRPDRFLAPESPNRVRRVKGAFGVAMRSAFADPGPARHSPGISRLRGTDKTRMSARKSIDHDEYPTRKNLCCGRGSF